MSYSPSTVSDINFIFMSMSYLRCKKFNAEKFQLNPNRGRNFSALDFSRRNFLTTKYLGGFLFVLFHQEIFEIEYGIMGISFTNEIDFS